MTARLRGIFGLGMLTLGIVLGLCAASAHVETGNVRAPSSSSALVADRLYFGRAIPGGGFVSEEDWAAFLRDVVTPRFPDGLTVWRAVGQWTDTRGQLVRESVVVLEVVHPPGPRPDSSLAAIAREYKRQFRQGAVLRVSTPSLGRLYQ